MASKSLDEVRSRLLSVMKDLGTCSNDQIIAEFDSRHPDLNEAAAADYDRIAKIKLISEASVRRQRTVPTDLDQPDLFGGLSHSIITISILRDGKTIHVRKDYLDATAEEAAAWIKSRKRPTTDDESKTKNERKILKDLQQYLKPGMTLREAAVLRAEAEKQKKA